MNKELEFLEEKHGHNSWKHYPPSKQQVAQWLKEYVEKQLRLHGVSGSLPVYATTFDDKGELEHQRFSVDYAGELITELSKKVNEFETFIDSFNENYR